MAWAAASAVSCFFLNQRVREVMSIYESPTFLMRCMTWRKLGLPPRLPCRATAPMKAPISPARQHTCLVILPPNFSPFLAYIPPQTPSTVAMSSQPPLTQIPPQWHGCCFLLAPCIADQALHPTLQSRVFAVLQMIQHHRIAVYKGERGDRPSVSARDRPAYGSPQTMLSEPEYLARSTLYAASRDMNIVAFTCE